MSETPRAGCTIIARNYLAQARVLARSFRAAHPEAAFYVLMADAIDDLPLTSNEPFTLVRLEELEMADLASMKERYTLKEFATAVKPSFLRHLLRRKNHTQVLYLDPDILVTDSLDPLFQALEKSSIVLTPHVLSPIPRGVRPDEREVLLVGTYNLGFIGVSSSPEALRMLDWWADRLKDGCRDLTKEGYFVDQKWMDLAPGFLDHTTIMRDACYNVAYWNLHERTVTQQEGQYFVNDHPLRFYHFSGFRPDTPDSLTKYETTHRLKDQPGLNALHAHYARLLREAGYDACKHLPYAFAAHGNDTAAPPERVVPRSFLARRHTWESYQRFCRFLRRQLGDAKFLTLRTWVRGERRLLKAAEARPHITPPPLPFGVNVCGYLGNTSGVGEATRGNVKALAAANVPHALFPIQPVTQHYASVPPQPYRFSLIQVNADQMPVFAGSVGAEYFHAHHSIGYWVWETVPFPTQWLPHFAPLREIWTASTFIGNMLSAVSPIPVQVMPHVVDIAPKRAKGRKEFQLPEDRFLFLFIFDYLSIFERKNPLAILQAFAQAFPSGEAVTLVLKSLHGSEAPEDMQRLKEALGDLPCIYLDAEMPRADVEDLMACCDSYVSLHRSEGFGLTIAEAMLLGKPVIATNYGGNTDFMDELTAFPVRATEVPLATNYGPYPEGSRWAEPDIEHAAYQMRFVFDHPAESALRAARAKAHIQEHYNARVIGEHMKERLMTLERYYG